MGDPEFGKAYTKGGRSGIYCRVIKSGMVSPGEPVPFEQYEDEHITMPDMLATFCKK